MQRIPRRSVTALVSVLALAGSFAPPASAYIAGYTNVLQLGGEVQTFTVPAGPAAAANMNGTEGWGAWTYDTSPGEFSYTWDWHTSATPTRSLRQLAFFTGAATSTLTFDVFKGVYNGGTGQTDWTLATRVSGMNGGESFKPFLVNLAIPVSGATGLKVQWVSGMDATPTRRLRSVLAFDTPINNLVSPDSAVTTLTNLNAPGISSVVDELANSVNQSVSPNGDGTAQIESITVTFDTPKTLEGVLVNLGPVHGPYYGWKTWQVKTAPGGTVLAQSQTYPDTEQGSADRFQLLRFPSVMSLSSFTLEGPFGIVQVPPGHPYGNAYLGEIWGVLPEPSSALLLFLACAAAGRSAFRRR